MTSAPTIRNPVPACGITSVLVAVSDGRPVCGRCVGVEHLDFTCHGCGGRGAIRSGGRCVRCVATGRLDELLRGENGTIPAPLRPLADALRVANPGSLLTWLRVSQSCQLLTQLLAQKTDITHDALDTLPQGTATRHIREILVSAGLLDRRNEDLAQLQLWAERIITTLPASQQRIVRPFAEWQIIRKARRTAARGIYREAAARRDRAQINAAIVFLNWLDTHHTPVGELTQHHVDAWFDTHRAKHRPVVAFLRWLSARGIIPTVEIPTRDQGLPQHFLDLDTHSQQLRRCLTDDTLPLEVRIAGALVRLYGMPLAAIVELTTDRFTRDETDAYLLFDTHPILLPPTLARLIEQMINRGGAESLIRTLTGDHSIYLFPGRPPTRPRNPYGLQRVLTRHGLPLLAARNTAMITTVADIPATVVSDLLGISPATAERWSRYAQNDWAQYLAHTRS